jgi:toxin ParE1/3/4
MKRFKFTNLALKDLSDIWNYTVLTWSERQADNYYQNEQLINNQES